MTEQIDISELSPHPKNREFYGDTTDVSDLVASIRDNGFDETECIEIVPEPRGDWPENRIVSGHRRYAAAREAGLDEVPVRTVEFDTEDDELDYLVRKNKYRQKTDAMLIREGYDFEQRHGDEIDGRTRDAVAERIGKSGAWYRMGKRVMLAAENGVLGDETLDAEAREVAGSEWDRIRNGHTSVSAAHQELERVNSDTDPNADDSERVKSNTDGGKVMSTAGGDSDVIPVNLGWVGDIEGERAAKAREMGRENLTALVMEAIDGYDN